MTEITKEYLNEQIGNLNKQIVSIETGAVKAIERLCGAIDVCKALLSKLEEVSQEQPEPQVEQKTESPAE